MLFEICASSICIISNVCDFRLFKKIFSKVESTKKTEEEMAKKIRILIAEDEPLDRELLGSMLIRLGYDVTYANDGEEVLEIIEKREFETILMDIKMPNLCGKETIRTIREYLKDKTPIIAVTALNLSLGSLLELGINNCVKKPINTQELLTAIKKVTSLSSPTRTIHI